MATRGHLRAFRLSFEGVGVQWATDAAMERTLADGRKVVRGLRVADGVTVEARVDPARAEIEASPMSVSVVDALRTLEATQWLAWQPSTVTYLAADVAASGGVTLTVSSSSGISAGDVIHVDTEALLVDAVPTGTTITVLSAGRGYWDTTAQAHYTSDGADLRAPAVYLSRISTLEGRRAEVYAYGRGDSLQGDGTLIFRGIATTDGKLSESGGEWSVSLDPLWSLAKQDIGADLSAPMQVRGIRYPSALTVAAALNIDLYESTSAVIGSTRGTYIDTIDLAGQSFADNDEFAAWANTQIAGMTLPASIASVAVVSDGDSGWHWAYTTGASPRVLWLEINTFVDGAPLETTNTDGSRVTSSTLSASTDYVIALGADPRSTRVLPGTPGAVPRGMVSSAEAILDVSGTVSLSGITDVTVEWPDGRSSTGIVSASSDSERTITLRLPPREPRSYTEILHAWAGTSPTVKLRRSYGYGTIGDLVAQVTSDAPANANRGSVPFITTADADVATWQSESDEASALRPIASHRRFIAAKETKFDELLREHMKLTGLMPTIDSAGRMSVRQLAMPLGTDIGLTALDTSNIIGTPTLERSSLGSVNQVILKTGYDPTEDDFLGTTYRVRDVRAFGARKSPRTLKVEPKSVDSPTTIEEVVELAEPVLGVFAHPYATLEIKVLWPTATAVYIGDGVSVTHPVIPDVSTGARGVTSMPGLVVGKSLDLAAAQGTLTVLVSYVDGAGYTPDVSVSSHAVVSGAQFDLVVTFDDPYGTESMAPASASLSDYFAVNDVLERIEWDNATQTPLEATVDSVTDGTMTLRVTFVAGAPASWADTYTMRYPSAASAVTAQQAYAYLAPDTAIIGFGTARRARVWGA